MTSEKIDAVAFVQLEVIVKRTASNLWMIMVQICTGNLLIVRLRIARPGEGEIMLPVIEDINVKMEYQKLPRLLQFHSIISSVISGPLSHSLSSIRQWDQGRYGRVYAV